MINRIKTGVATGAFLGGFHLFWVLLVGTGLGQVLYNFILWAHMLHVPVSVGPFDPLAAVVLILYSSSMGFVLGYIGAWVWNAVHAQ